MSESPEDRNKDTKKVSENNIEQPEPVNKQDPTEPVSVEGADNPSNIEGNRGSTTKGKGSAGTAQGI